MITVPEGIGLVSNNTTNDYDSDGCRDYDEDSDDDGDDITSTYDSCTFSVMMRSSYTNWTDDDYDGCEDLTEDTDDDNDGLNDTMDYWPNDPEAFGADTDRDGLPNEIFLTESSFFIDRTKFYPEAWRNEINFAHRENISLTLAGWSIPEESGSGSESIIYCKRPNISCCCQWSHDFHYCR